MSNIFNETAIPSFKNWKNFLNLLFIYNFKSVFCIINNILILIKKSKTLSRKTRRSRKRKKKKFFYRACVSFPRIFNIFRKLMLFILKGNFWCVKQKLIFWMLTKMALNINRGLITPIHKISKRRTFWLILFQNLYIFNSRLISVFLTKEWKKRVEKGLIFHLFTLFNI